jgi:hypothetical protein
MNQKATPCTEISLVQDTPVRAWMNGFRFSPSGILRADPEYVERVRVSLHRSGTLYHMVQGNPARKEAIAATVGYPTWCPIRRWSFTMSNIYGKESYSRKIRKS